MNRVISYVDGFNLYFGLKEKGWKKYYWLDLAGLSKSLMQSSQELQRCHYFSARVRGSESAKRQSIWLDAIATQPEITSHFGHYLEKTKACKKCGHSWKTHEEKMTDVNIATQLLSDGYENKFDTAIVISGDSDLTTPIKLILDRFPKKKVIVAFPPSRHSSSLRAVATASFTIGQAKIRKNILPESIQTTSGHILTKPDNWR